MAADTTMGAEYLAKLIYDSHQRVIGLPDEPWSEADESHKAQLIATAELVRAVLWPEGETVKEEWHIEYRRTNHTTADLVGDPDKGWRRLRGFHSEKEALRHRDRLNNHPGSIFEYRAHYVRKSERVLEP